MGPMAALGGGGAVSYDRGTPVGVLLLNKYSTSQNKRSREEIRVPQTWLELKPETRVLHSRVLGLGLRARGEGFGFRDWFSGLGFGGERLPGLHEERFEPEGDQHLI